MRHDRRATGVVGVLATGLLIAGCAGEPERTPVEVARTPTTDVEAPADADIGELRVPLQVDTVAIVDPGWDVLPQSADGVTIGAAERDGVLQFTAVGADGEALWAIERPADRTGFAVTVTSDGRALAVLTDDGESGAGTTATAYDLHTGDTVWGPVDVPGPQAGPGLVFAGGSEPVALHADSGEIVETEGTVVGEYDGTVLARDDAELVATGTSGDERWRVDLAGLGGRAEALGPGAEPAPTRQTARLRTGEESEALVDLADGSVLASGFTDVGVDPAIGAVVSVDEAELRGTDLDGAELWTVSAGQEASIEGVSGALAYLRVGESLRAHNVLTGSIAEAYAPEGTGDLVVPVDATDAGSVVLSDYSGYLLATTETSADAPTETDPETPAP